MGSWTEFKARKYGFSLAMRGIVHSVVVPREKYSTRAVPHTVFSQPHPHALFPA